MSSDVVAKLTHQLIQFLHLRGIVTFDTHHQTFHWHSEATEYELASEILTSLVAAIVEEWVRQGIRDMRDFGSSPASVVAMVRELVTRYLRMLGVV